MSFTAGVFGLRLEFVEVAGVVFMGEGPRSDLKPADG